MKSLESKIKEIESDLEAQRGIIKALTHDYISKTQLTLALNQIERLTFPSKGKILRILSNSLL